MSERFPHPKAWPFFYGWVALAAGTLGILASVPGQTFGVSAFTEPLLEALAMSRDQISLAYLVGTVASSLVLTFAGAAYDRYGACRVAAAASMLLGVVLAGLSRVDRMVAVVLEAIPALGAAWAGFAVLCVGFFLLRFSAQGVITMVSRNMMMKWFDRHRGLVTGISGLVIAPMFSAAPSVLNGLVESAGWRQTWLTMGMGVGLGFTVLVLLFYRDNPELYGLKPDGPLGEKPLGSHRHRGPANRQYTLAEARRMFTFWLFAVGISLFGMYMTGLSFHVASIFEEAGYSAAEGFAVFLPSAVITLVLRPFVGWAADRFSVRAMFLYLLSGLCLSGVGLARLGVPDGRLWLILGNGVAGSAYNTMMSITWPNLFGREHLGAISGLSMSVTVFTSALGPTLFSLSYTRLGSYEWCGYGIVALTLTAMLLSRYTVDPQGISERG